jgi:hypothetical protein
MTKDDVLFGYRLQLFAEAARTNVSAACRTFGCIARRTTPGSVRLTATAWRCSGRASVGARRCPTRMIEERIVAFSIAHPGLGPKRVASQLAREKWGGIIVSPNGVWKVLCRHGLNRRAKRLGLICDRDSRP